MKSRWNIIIVALLVVIGALAWTIVKGRQNLVPLAAAVVSNSKTPNLLTIRVETVPPSPTTAPSMAEVISPRPQAPPIASTNGTHDASKYTAQPGDTVSNLAAELPGGNRKINREAVINANPSLLRDPDRVLAGKTYDIPASPAVPAAPAAVIVPVEPAPAVPTPAEKVHELKYVARAGDTVSTLAAALLGSDTKENRDAIIGANPSLQSDPDRMIAGQTYRIPVHASQPLASAAASELPAAPRPTTQPDADSVVRVGSPRELRYTARAGDNVSTLATALLGSDTKENRDAIINNNKSLMLDPDRVVAGQTYWIPAPMPQQ